MAASRDRALVEFVTSAPEGLGRALAAMGFDELGAPMPRGECEHLPARYSRLTPWRRRIGESDTEAGRGFRAGAWDARTARFWDGADAIERGRLACRNRALAGRAVRIVRRGPPDPLAIALDELTAEWADLRGGARGDDIGSLAAYVWRVPVAEAIARLAALLTDDAP
jgi:hypothetical protein